MDMGWKAFKKEPLVTATAVDSHEAVPETAKVTLAEGSVLSRTPTVTEGPPSDKATEEEVK